MRKRGKSHGVNASGLSHALQTLRGKINNSLGDASERATEVPGLMLYRNVAPPPPSPCAYEPSLLLIAQGIKRVALGKTTYVFGQSRFLLTSLELPVVSQVITACPGFCLISTAVDKAMSNSNILLPGPGGAAFETTPDAIRKMRPAVVRK